MAMEVIKVIEEAHEAPISSIAFNSTRKEIYSSADGDKVIRVWDCKTGQLVRTQQGHKGSITCLAYSSTVRLLFSGSIDNTVGIWTDKGVNLQMAPVGGPVFSIAWDCKLKYLVVGGNAVIQIFKVDMMEARKTTQQQRSVASGLKDTTVMDAPQILKRLFQPLKGPDLCHTDVVSCVAVTDTGKIITGGFDKCICMYEFDKLDKPREAFQRISKCHTAAIVSMAYDTFNNVVLTGSIDGSMKVWSMEGRNLDKFENINDQPVAVSYVPSTNMYWASGRFGRLVAYDPRAPSNVTEFVKESNGLDKYKVDCMFAPVGTDMLLGSTKQRQLIMWQYNQTAAYRIFRKHEDWVESVIMVRPAGADESTPDEIYSCAADGKVLRWQLDVEQNCDIYRCIEEFQLHEKNIYCMVYSDTLECLITGGEDATIQLHYLSGVVPTFNDVPLPTSFTDHEARVTGLVLLKNNMLASISFDKTLRIWDLTTMKLVTTVAQAHDTPLQCLEYCEELDQLATCGMGNKVKIWDIRKPDKVRQVLSLDHADVNEAEELKDKKGPKKTNMTWLTRSDMAGLPTATGIVLESIQAANRDVPEVTQVRWVHYRECWVTAADDDMIRLWSAEGQKLHQFSYSGGSVQCLFVDNVNKLLVAAMMDKNAYVYDLDDPMPRARYSGHNDVIRGVAYVKESDTYVTASWDRSLRLWFRPQDPRKMSPDSRAGQPAQDVLMMEYDEDEETFVSEYEKQHPLEVPRALTEANQWQLLKAIGVLEDEKAPGSKRGKRAQKMAEAELGLDAPAPDVPGTLGAKLEDLGRSLLHEINTMATRPPAGRLEDERASTRSSQVINPGTNGIKARAGVAGARPAASSLAKPAAR